jgi:hypothetical protein
MLKNRSKVGMAVGRSVMSIAVLPTLSTERNSSHFNVSGERSSFVLREREGPSLKTVLSMNLPTPTADCVG